MGREIYYFPAVLTPIYVDNYRRIISEDPKLCPWLPGSLVYHPYLMISYGIFLTDDPVPKPTHGARELREILRIDDSVLVMVDSGGFQISSRGKRFDVIAGFQWQRELGNIVISLDFPPRSRAVRSYYGIEYPEEEVTEAIRQTRKYLERLRPYYERCDRDIYLVLHGSNLEQFKRWWKECIEPFLDIAAGIFIPAKTPYTPLIAILGMFFAYEQDADRIHVAGASGPARFLPGLVYARMALDDLRMFSFDTSSVATHSVGFGHFTVPFIGEFNLGYTAMRGGKAGSLKALGRCSSKRALTEEDCLPCACPACEYARRRGIEKMLILYPSKYPYNMYIICHMLWVVKHSVSVLRVVTVRDPEKYIPQEEVIKFVDLYRDLGDVEKAWAKVKGAVKAGDLGRWFG